MRGSPARSRSPSSAAIRMSFQPAKAAAARFNSARGGRGENKRHGISMPPFSRCPHQRTQPTPHPSGWELVFSCFFFLLYRYCRGRRNRPTEVNNETQVHALNHYRPGDCDRLVRVAAIDCKRKLIHGWAERLQWRYLFVPGYSWKLRLQNRRVNPGTAGPLRRLRG